MRSLHAAERKLLAASQRAEIEQALAACAARRALASAAKAQAITAEFAGRIAALTAMSRDREAAVQRIKAEETAALASLYLAASHDGEQERRAVVFAIKLEHARALARLNHRQRIERMVMAVKSAPVGLSRRIRSRAWSAMRRVLLAMMPPRSH
ncbi:MAG: hypothetical protein ABL901_03130 [Hyphomicrobiaceae bacterium]